MKIGIDASRYAHSEATGVEWYSWHIINALLEQIGKDDKDDVSSKPKSRSGSRTDNEVILYSKSPLHAKSNFSPAAASPLHLKITNRVLPFKRLWTLWKLSAEMKKNPPDVLFVPSHVLPLYLPKKSVITIHDTAFRHLKKSYSFLEYHYLNWSTKFAVKNATKIIVPSEATKKDLIEFFNCPKGKITVIQHGFEPPNFTQADIDKVFRNSEIFKYFDITKNSPYIFFVGRLESKKNLARLIEAFEKFLKKYPDYRLILAGKRGTGFEQILKTVNRLKLNQKVIMPGYITEEEKAVLYKYCQIFAFPSLYEGFGLPILEAFYYEKPVLTSFVSCLPEVAGDAVYYVDPKNIHAIYEGLDTLVSNKDYVRGLVKLGKERLKLFSWKIAAKKTLDVILN